MSLGKMDNPFLDYVTNNTAGLTPEYYAEDRGGTLIAIAVVFIVLTTVMVALQFYAKQFQPQGLRRFDLYDAFLLAGYFGNLVVCVLAILSTKYAGIGRHIEAVERDTPSQVRGWAIYIFAFEISNFISVALPKMAMIFLYLRVFNWTGTRRRLAHLLLALTAALSVSLVVAACLQCEPLNYWWDRDVVGGRCFDIQTFFHAQSIPGFIIDLAIVALPLGSIWQMSFPLFKKIALAMVFLVGSFGMVASIIRATVFFSTEALTDKTMASVELQAWSVMETSTYIITACLPALRPLVVLYTPQVVRDAARDASARLSNALSEGSKAVETVSRATRRGLGLERRSIDDVVELVDTDAILERARAVREREEADRRAAAFEEEKRRSHVSAGSSDRGKGKGKEVKRRGDEDEEALEVRSAPAAQRSFWWPGRRMSTGTLDSSDGGGMGEERGRALGRTSIRGDLRFL